MGLWRQPRPIWWICVMLVQSWACHAFCQYLHMSKMSSSTCDSISIIKIYQIDLYKMYNDPNISFHLENFIKFMDVVVNTSSRITKDWVTNLNDGTRHLPLHIFGQFHMVHFVDSLSNIQFAITWECFQQVIKVVKVQCIIAHICWSLNSRVEVFRS